MVSITEAKQQIEQQKQMIAGKRIEASQVSTQLSDIRSKLPQVTQRGLRQGSFAGLKGRLRREALQKTKTSILTKEGLVESYRAALKGYEEETLEPFEEKIKQAEIQQREAESYNYALRVYLGLTSGGNIGSVPESIRQQAQSKAEEIERTQSGAQKLALQKYERQYETDFPTEDLQIDYTQMRIAGVDSGALGETLSIEDYNKRISQLNKEIKEMPSVTEFVDISKDLPRTEREQIKELKDIDLFSMDFLPSVSAQPVMMPSVVEEAPSMGERYIEFIKEKGPLAGTFSFAGEKISGFATQVGLGPVGKYRGIPLISAQEIYQPYALGKIGSALGEIGRIASIDIKYKDLPKIIPTIPTIPEIKGVEAQYLTTPDITMVSTKIPGFGTVQVDPLSGRELPPMSELILPGKVDVTIPTTPELIGRGTRFLGERTPIIKDIVESKRLIDIKAQQSQDILRQLEDPNLSAEEVQKLINKYKTIGGKVKKETKDGETFYQLYEPTVIVGAFEETKRKVPVAQLSDKGLLRYGTTLFTGEIGAMYKGIGEELLPEEGFFQYTTEAKDISIFEPQFGTAQYDLKLKKIGIGDKKIEQPFYGPGYKIYEKGEPISFIEKKLEVPAKTYKIGTPGQLGKVAEIYSEVVTFPVSYFGGGAEAIFTAGEFGGPKTAWGYVKKYPVETALFGTIGGATLGAKGLRYLKTPKIKITELKPTGIPKEPWFSVSKPLERYSYVDPLTGKMAVKETYNLLGIGKRVVKPGRKVEVTTRGRELFKMKPLTREKSLKALRKSSGYGKKELEAIEEAGKLGGLTKEEFVKKLSIEGISKKEAERMFLIEGRIKETLRLRRPQVVGEFFKGKGVVEIPEEGLTKFYVKGEEKILPAIGEVKGVKYLKKEPEIRFIESLGVPEGEKLFRVSTEAERAFLRKGKYPYTKLSQLGKTTKKYESLVGAKKIGDFPTVEVYKQLEVGKQIIPKKRFIDVSKAKVLVAKGRPGFIISDEAIIQSRGFIGGTKKSSKQFYKQLYKTDEGLVSTILARPKPILKTKAPSIPTAVAEVVEKPASSLYFGKGMYERTGGGLIPSVSAKLEVSPVSLSTVYLPSRVESQFIEVEKTRIGIGTRQLIDTRTKAEAMQLLESPTKVGERQIFVPSFKQPQRLEVVQKQKELFRQREISAQAPMQKVRQVQIVKPGRPRPPQPKPPYPKPPKPKIPFGILEDEKKKRKLKKKKELGLVVPFIRRYGKFIPVSKPVTLERAEKIGRAKLLTTLGASLQIRKVTGEPLKIAKESRIFRAGKKGKDPFTLVQRRGARLGRPQEVREIIKARKGKWL